MWCYYSQEASEGVQVFWFRNSETMQILADYTVLSFSQGNLRDLVVFLALISTGSWVLTILTAIIRSIVRSSYKRLQAKTEE